MLLISNHQQTVASRSAAECRKTLLCQNAIKLDRQNFKSAFAPDNEISLGDLFFNRPLCRQPLADLFRIPSAFTQTFPLSCSRAGDADRRVKFLLNASFKQQWDDHYSNFLLLRAPLVNLSFPPVTNERMCKTLQFVAGGGIRKNNPGEFITAQPAIGADDDRAKGLFNLCESGFAGFNNFSGQQIRVYERHATLRENL